MPGIQTGDGLDAIGIILSDGTVLDIGAIAPGEFLQRQGSEVNGAVSIPGGGDIDPLTNVLFVDKAGSDLTGDGSIAAPYLTVQKACDVIGNAADVAEWNDATKQSYIVIVTPGTYTEDVSFPIRPNFVLKMWGSCIVGDCDITVGVNYTSGIASPRWVFEGESRRPGWEESGDFITTGIVGTLTFHDSTNTGHSWFTQVHLIKFAIIKAANTNAFIWTGGNWTGGQVFLDDAIIKGLTHNATSQSVSVWARGRSNEEAGDIEGIGGYTGGINMLQLSDVLISDNCSPTGSVDGWRWYNTRLLGSKTFDFSGVGGAVDVFLDANSCKEYADNTTVPQRFPGTVIFVDDAHCINYDPTTESDWPAPAPEDVGDALDILAQFATDAPLRAEFYFIADYVEDINPAGTDWAVDALAEVAPDDLNDGLPARYFDDTDEEGLGFTIHIPVDAGDLSLNTLMRPVAAGGGVARWKLYWREITDGGATGAWSAGLELGGQTFGASTDREKFAYANDLVSLGLNIDTTYQFELTRDAGHGSDTLVSDVLLFDLLIRFTGTKTLQYFAGHFSLPKNSDWVVNAFAPEDIDDLNAGLNNRLFDDTVEEGVGFEERVPLWADNVKFDFLSRPVAAGGGNIVPKLYFREILTGGATGAWSVGLDLTALVFAAATDWESDTQTILLSTLGVTPGQAYQFQLTRDPVDAGDTLVSDWLLHELDVRWL